MKRKLKYKYNTLLMHKDTKQLWTVTCGRHNCGFPYYYIKPADWKDFKEGNYLHLSRSETILDDDFIQIDVKTYKTLFTHEENHAIL